MHVLKSNFLNAPELTVYKGQHMMGIRDISAVVRHLPIILLLSGLEASFRHFGTNTVMSV